MGFFNPFDIFKMIIDNEIEEAAVDEAIDAAYSMCGNEGQEAIVSEGEGPFRDWAAGVISGEGGGDVGGVMSAALGSDKYSATDQIWDEAADIVESSTSWGMDDDDEFEGDEGPGLFDLF